MRDVERISWELKPRDECRNSRGPIRENLSDTIVVR
jgi:hypothetical protein